MNLRHDGNAAVSDGAGSANSTRDGAGSEGIATIRDGARCDGVEG